MRALVTGAGGFCGKHLCDYLRSIDVEVHTLGNRRENSECHHYIEDITDSAAIAQVLTSLRPDYIFHLAGVSYSADSALYYRVNTGYAAALLQAVKTAELGDRPTLLVGTSAEYGAVRADDLPIREDLAVHPYNHYGISKLAQTLLGLAAAREGLNAIMVRPFNIIGAGMPEHLVLASFAGQLLKIVRGEQPPMIEVGNLESSRDFVDVGEVIRIYWRLAGTPAAYGKIINVSSGKPVVIRELLERMLKVASVQVDIRTEASRFKATEIAAHYGSNKRLAKLLGYVPNRSMDSTLDDIWKSMVYSA
jgi:GDP-4-dehydro-6-deoxy-D-mannose reductase